MWNELDGLREKMNSDVKGHVMAGTASFVSAGATVAYLLWALRAGSLLSSMVSSLPAWNMVDPLPILDEPGAGGGENDDDKEDEGIESLVE